MSGGGQSRVIVLEIKPAMSCSSAALSRELVWFPATFGGQVRERSLANDASEYDASEHLMSKDLRARRVDEAFSAIKRLRFAYEFLTVPSGRGQSAKPRDLLFMS